MQPANSFDELLGSRSRAKDRVSLFGLVALISCAGFALAAVGGPPRWPPPGMLRVDQVGAILSGSWLPVELLALVLVDAAWLMWAWIVGSLGLELVVAGAEVAAHGAVWVHALRRLSRRLSFPLARRAVAAAFAVQILARGVPLVGAEPLAADESALVANRARQTPSIAHAPNAAASDGPAYTVRSGDTLWTIADAAYGSGTSYRRLVDANIGRRMPDGHVFTARGVIQPGWELLVPDATWGIEEVAGERVYTVRAGDSLSTIAATVLGAGARWVELFELNAGATSPDGAHSLSNPDVIWPGLRLRLPSVPPASPAIVAAEPATVDVLVASSFPNVPVPMPLDVPAEPPDAPTEIYLPPMAVDAEPEPLPPLLRTPHTREPVVLESSDLPDPGAVTGPADESLPARPPSGDVPIGPLAFGGAGVLALAGAVVGMRRLRRLRPLPRQPETEVVVEGGFAEAQLTGEFTRGLAGLGADPLTATAIHLQRFLDEHQLDRVGLVAARYGRSATTLTLSAGLADQPLVVELAPLLAERMAGDAEAWISADQDVVVRLARLRNTRVPPAGDGLLKEPPCLIPLGVLYDRQVYVAAWTCLGNVLIASLPGHGADTILTSLVATLTARTSPQRLQVWCIARPRALPAPLFELPHLVHTVDPEDDSALEQAVERLRAELELRGRHGASVDLAIVVPEIAALGAHATSLELLAGRAADLGVRFLCATSSLDDALDSPLLSHLSTRMVLRMPTEDTSVALLGVADAAFLGGGGRLLLRLDGREPVELYGYQVAADHLDRLVRVMRSTYGAVADDDDPPQPPDTAPLAEGVSEDPGSDAPADAHPQGLTPPDSPTLLNPATPSAAPAPTLEVICFGGPRVLCGGQQVWPKIGGGEVKPWEFLLYLACQPAAGVSSEDAVQALWPEDDEPVNAPHRFRQLRYRLRQLLAGVAHAPESDGVCLDRGTLRLDPAVVRSDAQEFLELVRTARITPGPEAIPQLERARALYVGDVFEGPDARRYGWLDERGDSGVTLREHFRRLFHQASARLAEEYTAAGQLEAAISVLRELTDSDPGDEQLWCALFRLHTERGDRLGLIREERRMRTALQDLAVEIDGDAEPEFEEPSRETMREYQRLLASLREPAPERAAV